MKIKCTPMLQVREHLKSIINFIEKSSLFKITKENNHISSLELFKIDNFDFHNTFLISFNETLNKKCSFSIHFKFNENMEESRINFIVTKGNYFFYSKSLTVKEANQLFKKFYKVINNYKFKLIEDALSFFEFDNYLTDYYEILAKNELKLHNKLIKEEIKPLEKLCEVKEKQIGKIDKQAHFLKMDELQQRKSILINEVNQLKSEISLKYSKINDEYYKNRLTWKKFYYQHHEFV